MRKARDSCAETGERMCAERREHFGEKGAKAAGALALSEKDVWSQARARHEVDVDRLKLS